MHPANPDCDPAALSAKRLTAAPGLQQGLDADLKETRVLLAGHICTSVKSEDAEVPYVSTPACSSVRSRQVESAAVGE